MGQGTREHRCAMVEGLNGAARTPSTTVVGGGALMIGQSLPLLQVTLLIVTWQLLVLRTNAVEMRPVSEICTLKGISVCRVVMGAVTANLSKKRDSLVSCTQKCTNRIIVVTLRNRVCVAGVLDAQWSSLARRIQRILYPTAGTPYNGVT